MALDLANYETKTKDASRLFGAIGKKPETSRSRQERLIRANALVSREARISMVLSR